MALNRLDLNEANQEHYTSLSIEPIDYMRSTLSAEQFEGFLRANVLKYVSRYKLKNGIEDINKAIVYLDWLKQHLEE